MTTSRDTTWEPEAREPEYTSETEDLSTWPETRGNKWREMGDDEVMRLGDVVFNGFDSEYEWVDGFCGSKLGDEPEAMEAWTRRPAIPKDIP